MCNRDFYNQQLSKKTTPQRFENSQSAILPICHLVFQMAILMAMADYRGIVYIVSYILYIL